MQGCGMPLAFTVTLIAGTIVRMHVLLPLFLGWLLLNKPVGIPEGLQELSVLAAFLALAVHEAAHFLVAHFSKISLLEAKLYPFGARYQFRSTPTAHQQFLFFFIPIAVNAFIGTIIMLVPDSGQPEGSLVANIEYVIGIFGFYNIFLAALNLCPCTPLDGGMLLRSFLEKHSVARPGKIVSRVSQGFCFVVALLAFFISTPITIALAAVLLLVSLKDKMEGRIIINAEGMTAQSAAILFATVKRFPHNYTLTRALHEASVSAQEIFPVFFSETLVGFVTSGLLLEEAAAEPEERYLTEVAIRENTLVAATTPLAEIVEIFTQEDVSIVVVTQQDAPIGFILKETLLNFLVVKGIQKDQRDLAESDSDIML